MYHVSIGHLGACIHQEIKRFLVHHPDPSAVQYLQAGQMDLLALIGG
jgi:hypothetical protein